MPMNLLSKIAPFCLVAILLQLFAVDVLAGDCTGAAEEISAASALASGSLEEERAYRRAAESCPSLVEAHYNLGLNLLSQNKVLDARSSLEKAVALRKDQQTLLALANAYALSGDLDKARNRYQDVLNLDKTSVDAMQGISVSTTDKEITSAPKRY